LTEAPSQAPSQNKTIFVRNATGLVRQLSWVDVFVWSILFFPWLTSWSGVFWVTPDYYLHVNYYAALGLWAVIAMVIVVLYWQLTAAMPRSGGDYVFVSRTLGTPVGFVVSFIFFVAILSGVSASGAYWAFSETGTQLSFSGEVLNNTAITNLGNAMSPFTTTVPWELFGVSCLILVIGVIGVIMGGRLFRTIVYSFFIYGAFALIIVGAMFALNSNATFMTDYAKYFSGGVPQVFANAAKAGYIPGTTLATLGVVVPVILISLGPFPTMQTVGGEIKNPRKSLLYGAVLAEFVSVLVFIGMTALYDNSVGIKFAEAWTTTVGGGFSIVPSAFAFVFYPNTLLLWVICIGLFLGNIGWWWLGLVFASRLPMSWSFDRITPSQLAHVSNRFHTPTVAIILVACLSLIPTYLTFFTSFITTQVNGTFLFSVAWIFSAISAIILPFRRKNIYELSGSQAKFAGLPVISWIGIISVIVIGYFSYNALTNPAIGPFATGAKIVLLGVLITPIAIYTASHYYNKRRGINLEMIAAQLPPD
jgi:basic amino acid/polyamine antiporter, APA family